MRDAIKRNYKLLSFSFVCFIKSRKTIDYISSFIVYSTQNIIFTLYSAELLKHRKGDKPQKKHGG